MYETPPLLTIKRPSRRPTQAQIDSLKNVPSAVATDAMDGRGALIGTIRHLDGGQRLPESVVGPALTAWSGAADLLALQDKLVTLENIQRVVAEYFKIRVADLLSKRRSRSIARPRQIAMALAKELTRHSLPEIGDAFGGRDHTTVIHAVNRIKELRSSEVRVAEDYNNLLRTLTS